MKKFFSSDWHLDDDRIGINGNLNILLRPFTSVEEQRKTIVHNFFSKFRDGDELYFLGDLFVNPTEEDFKWLNYLFSLYPKSKFHMIFGNYDIAHARRYREIFDYCGDTLMVELKDGSQVALNHYPRNFINQFKFQDMCKSGLMALTGHIHGAWRVKPNMINVGVDAHHFQILSEDDIIFLRNAVWNFYDDDVFMVSDGRVKPDYVMGVFDEEEANAIVGEEDLTYTHEEMDYKHIDSKGNYYYLYDLVDEHLINIIKKNERDAVKGIPVMKNAFDILEVEEAVMEYDDGLEALNQDFYIREAKRRELDYED